MRRWWIQGLVAGVVLALMVPGPPLAAEASTEVVLRGIDNPRGLAVHGGTLFVAAAGRGGSGTCVERDGAAACYGTTGALLRVPSVADVTDETVTPAHVLNSGNPLPSLAEAGRNAAGPADVAVGNDGHVYYTIGLGGSHKLREQLVEASQDNAYRLATVRRMRADGSDDREVADLGNLERDTDPDGKGSNTDPNGLVVDTTRERASVLDTGGNTLVDVTIGAPDPASSTATTRLVFPRYGSGPGSLPAAPTQMVEEDGRLWVAQRVGDGAPAGSATVWEVAGGEVRPWARGLTDAVDVAWYADELYVLEQDHDGPGTSATGALVRVTIDDGTATREVLLDDLDTPGGMAFDAQQPGALYITTGATGPGGRVLRIADVAELGVENSVEDRRAPTFDDHRLVVGEDEEDAYQTVAPSLSTEPSDQIEVLDAAHGAVWQDGENLVYLPAAHQGDEDTVSYRRCNGDACVVGVLHVDVRHTDVDRIAGPTRISTAVEAAQGRYPDGSAAVLLARADLYPDALAGGPLAHAVGGPILLTSSTELAPEVAEEIRRLDPATIYLLGGPAALGDAVQAAAESLAPGVVRLAGPDRFATAARVATELESVTDRRADRVAVVEGVDADPARGWPDAVAVSALAAHAGWPILLVETDVLPPATSDAVAGRDATIVGGPVAVGAAVEALLVANAGTVERIAGDTRYETSRLIAERAHAEGLTRDVVTLVSGGNWPDALVAGPLVARTGGAFLLVPPDAMPADQATWQFLSDRGPFSDIDLFGGSAAITEAAADAISQAAG